MSELVEDKSSRYTTFANSWLNRVLLDNKIELCSMLRRRKHYASTASNEISYFYFRFLAYMHSQFEDTLHHNLAAHERKRLTKPHYPAAAVWEWDGGRMDTNIDRAAVRTIVI